MEGKEEDVKLGANKFSERQPIGTSAQTDKDYKEPPPAPLFEPGELHSWSFWRAGIAEFIATFLFLYITILTVMGYSRTTNKCATVGVQGIAWAFGGMIFALVYCTAGISGITPSLSLWACLFFFCWEAFVFETCTQFLGCDLFVKKHGKNMVFLVFSSCFFFYQPTRVEVCDFL